VGRRQCCRRVPADASNRLFSPYVQTEIGRRQGGKGSGLGLALVRQIIKLSNGRLGVESEAGKGSMFWFELPYSLPPPSSRSRHTSGQPGFGSSGPGGGPGGGEGSTTWSPILSRASTAMGLATPTLGMIKEGSGTGEASAGDAGGAGGVAVVAAGDTVAAADQDSSQDLERPGMVTTESTMPLLADRRRSSSSGLLGLPGMLQ